MPALQASLRNDGIVIPTRMTSAGRQTGGGSFGRGQLYWILKNPIYAGPIMHAGEMHPGQHEAIIDPAVWDNVKATLAANNRTRRQPTPHPTHLLTGRIHDAAGQPMTPSHAQKAERRCRYYLAKAVQRGHALPSPVRRISAPAIEAEVLSALRAAIDDAPLSDRGLVERHLAGVVVHLDRMELRLTDETILQRSWSLRSLRPRREIVLPPARHSASDRPMKAENRNRILAAIAMARSWTDEITSGRIASLDHLIAREARTERSVRMTLSLASLAPSIVRLLMEGRLPRGIGLRDLVDLPYAWTEQEQALGL